jgi:RNA polymerase sigma-54 factor
MLKQRLSQKLLQKLSPQQIQMIKLLEIPTMQLEQRIKKELEENPVLEEGAEDQQPNEQQEGLEEETNQEKDQDQEEFSLDDYLNDEDIPSYRLATKNYSKDGRKKSRFL